MIKDMAQMVLVGALTTLGIALTIGLGLGTVWVLEHVSYAKYVGYTAVALYVFYGVGVIVDGMFGPFFPKPTKYVDSSVSEEITTS